VRRLHATSSDAHEIVWDGRDGSGRVVGSGVYFLRTVGGGEERTIRIVKMR
jgi:hypothetical protein